jgi:uncharacterized caspase-like protein
MVFKRYFILTVLFLGLWTTVLAYNNTYAVIVGVSDYQYDYFAKDLPYTLNEVEAVYSFLRSTKGGSVPAENICLLTDSNATKANIILRASTLFAKAKKNDRVIFYFGGHGGEGSFAPYDFNGFYDSTLTYDDIKSIFKCARCNTKLLFADACYSGGIKGEARNTDNSGKTSSRNNTGNMNIVVMTASQADQYSWQTSEFEMGVFTHYLIEGLGGAANRDHNKYITIQELYYYVYHKVMDKTKYYETQQTPQIFGKFDLRLIVAKV